MTGPPSAVAAVRVAVRSSLRGLPAQSLVLVACSGGADSLALAAALAFEAPRRGLRAGGVTIDHGLQPRSATRARSVAAWLMGRGLDPVECVHVAVSGRGGPEGAARAARRAALEAVAVRHASKALFLGHTRDDQAETVLLGLARGSGARSLAGMPATAPPYYRPLLGLDRRIVRQAAHGLPVWNDPHNSDLRYARVRVRLSAMPTLEQNLGPGVAAALARSADLLRADADALEEWSTRAAEQCAVSTPEGLGLDLAALSELPEAVRRRLLRQTALSAGSPAADLTYEHVVAMERLVLAYHGQRGVDLPGGLRALRRGPTLLLSVAGTRPTSRGSRRRA